MVGNNPEISQQQENLSILKEFDHTFRNKFEPNVYNALSEYANVWGKKEQRDFIAAYDLFVEEDPKKNKEYILGKMKGSLPDLNDDFADFEDDFSEGNQEYSALLFLKEFKESYGTQYQILLEKRKIRVEKKETLDESIQEARAIKEKYSTLFDSILRDKGITEIEEGVYVEIDKNGNETIKPEDELYRDIFKNHGDRFLEAAKRISRTEYVELYTTFESFEKNGFADMKNFTEGFKNENKLREVSLDPKTPHGDAKVFQVETVLNMGAGDLDVDGNKFKINDELLEGDTKYIVADNGFRIESTDVSHVQRNRKYLMDRYKVEKDLGEVNAKIKPKDKKIAGLESVQLYLDEHAGEELPFGSTQKEIEISLGVISDFYSGNTKIILFMEGLDGSELDSTKQKALYDFLQNQTPIEIMKLENERQPLLTKKEECEGGIRRLDHDESARIEGMKDKIELEDKNAREMMNALRLLGMHLLPQSVFDHIVKIINEEGALKGAIKLRGNRGLSGNVDFGNLEVGQTSGETYKTILVQLINKALTGNPELPHSVSGFEKGSVLQMSPEEVRHKARTEWGIINDTGGVNKEKLKENLTKEVQQLIDYTVKNSEEILDSGKRLSRRQVKYNFVKGEPGKRLGEKKEDKK